MNVMTANFTFRFPPKTGFSYNVPTYAFLSDNKAKWTTTLKNDGKFSIVFVSSKWHYSKFSNIALYDLTIHFLFSWNRVSHCWHRLFKMGSFGSMHEEWIWPTRFLQQPYLIQNSIFERGRHGSSPRCNSWKPSQWPIHLHCKPRWVLLSKTFKKVHEAEIFLFF